jgi:hypothetical protein
MQDNKPRNEKGELHGPFQDYFGDGRPWEKSHYVNDVAYGYSEINSLYEDTPKITYYFCR